MAKKKEIAKPRYTVLRLVDAYVRYTTEVEASSPEEAARLAYRDEEQYAWKQDGVSEYDARLVYTLDEDGNEMESTKQGDL